MGAAPLSRCGSGLTRVVWEEQKSLPKRVCSTHAGPAHPHTGPAHTQFSTVQFSSVTQSCPTLCDPMNRSTPGLPVHHQLQSSLRLTSMESVMPSSHLILCCPLLLLPPTSPSIRVFSNESTLRLRWPKYWSLSFSIIPSKE